MWAVDQISSLTFPNYESTLNREWLGQAVSRQRPATARLNNLQGSTRVLAASGDGSVDQMWVEPKPQPHH